MRTSGGADLGHLAQDQIVPIGKPFANQRMYMLDRLRPAHARRRPGRALHRRRRRRPRLPSPART